MWEHAVRLWADPRVASGVSLGGTPLLAAVEARLLPTDRGRRDNLGNYWSQFSLMAVRLSGRWAVQKKIVFKAASWLFSLEKT